MTDVKLWTSFVNKRKGRVVVTTPEGTAICTVPSGESKKICSHDPKFLWSRFSKVTYLPKGVVEVAENSDWKNPWTEEHVIELVNLSRPNQIISIDGNQRIALCGIPTLVPISTNDPLIETARITWKLVTRKFRREGDPRYVYRETRVEQVKEPRARREMKAIKKELQLREEAKVKVDLDHRFPSLKGTKDEQA